MSQLLNRKVVLKSHPQGALKESDFEVVNDEVGEVTAGSVLVRVDVLSIDAFIRTTLDGGGFHTSAQLGGVVPALGVGTVVESADLVLLLATQSQVRFARKAMRCCLQ